MMTVREMRDLLDAYDDDAPIVCATQPNYPIAVTVSGLATYAEAVESGALDDDDDDETYVMRDDERGTRADRSVVWIVTGSSPYPDGYAPRWAWDV